MDSRYFTYNKYAIDLKGKKKEKPLKEIEVIDKQVRTAIDIIFFVRQLEREQLGRDPLEVYTLGNCGNMAEFLKKGAPILPVYYTMIRPKGEHIVSKLYDKFLKKYFFLDIRGFVDPEFIKDSQILREATPEDIQNCSNNYTCNAYNERDPKKQVILEKAEKKLMHFNAKAVDKFLVDYIK